MLGGGAVWGPEIHARHVLRAPCVALAVIAALAMGAPVARADRSMETIVQDDAVLLDGNDAQVASAAARLAALGVTRVRLTASWSTIAPQADSSTAPHFDATDPNAYPPHAWDRLDRAVRDATANGLRLDIDIAFWAPLWATSDIAASHARRYIDAAAYAQFAQAVARRYSGSFVPPATQPPPAPSSAPLVPVAVGGIVRPVADLAPMQPQPQPQPQPQSQRPLPRVDMYTIWNEPNWGGFLEPQWIQSAGQWQPESAEIYRQLVYAAYPAIHQVDPRSTILVGGTASTGGGPGADSVPPLEFIRQLACVDDHLRPLTSPPCQNFKAIPGEGWAHHPYAFGGPPGRQSANTRNATIAELPRLTALLGRLVTMGRLSPGLRDIWITEFGYPTGSQLTWTRLTESQQARFMAWAEYLAWSTRRVRSFAQFLIQDVPGYQTGLYQSDGTPKIAAQTFSTPLWAQYPLLPWGRASSARSPTMTVWLHARTARGATQVRLEQLQADGSWQPLTGTATWGSPTGVPATQFTTDPSGYLLVRLRAQGGVTLRADLQTADDWRPGVPTASLGIVVTHPPRVRRGRARGRHPRPQHPDVRSHR
jgi:hypothetical protein